MSYRISYEPEFNSKYPVLPGKRPRKKLWMICAALVLVAVAMLSPVRSAVLNLILPGDPQVTKSALSDLVEQVGAGEGLGVAVTAFCREILQGA